MKRFLPLLILLLTLPVMAEGPLFRHQDTYDNQEFDNVYQDLRSVKSVVTSKVTLNTWTSYTPAFQGLGTPTSVTARYLQMGNILFIQGQFVFGTTTASEARIGLPGGFTTNSGIPTSPTNQMVGYGNYVANQVTQYPITAKPSVTYVNITAIDSTHNNGTLLNGNDIFSTGNGFVFYAMVPL